MVQFLIEHRHNFTFFSEQHNCEEIPYDLSNLILIESTVDGKKKCKIVWLLTMKACKGSRGIVPQTYPQDEMSVCGHHPNLAT
jgi:hypothetical protein